MRVIRDANLLTRLIWGALILACVISLFTARWSLAFVALATFALTLVPPLLASRWSLALPRTYLLASTVFIFCSVFLGEAFDFYERYWWWDISLHGFSAVGFGLFGFLFIFMLFEGDRFAAPPSALAFLAFCVGMMVGAVWEIFEFAMDQLFGLNMQKSGLVDTMGDLIVDAVGAAFASLSGYLYLRGKGEGPLGDLITVFIQRNREFYQRFRNRNER
jgi:hypothetical protein